MKDLSPSFIPALAHPATVSEVFKDWTDSLSPSTRTAYMEDVRYFSRWCQDRPGKIGIPDGEDFESSVAWFYRQDGITANRIIIEYRNFLDADKKSPATINRRIACLKTLAKFFHAVGLIPWTITVKELDVIAYRDTKGPGIEAVRAVVHEAKLCPFPHNVRNELLILFLFTLGLRVSEVVKIDTEDLDLAKSRVRVLGKGKKSKAWITLPAGLYKKILSWLEIRQKYALDKKGPLFVDIKQDAPKSAMREYRMTRIGIFYIIRRLGAKAGIDGLHPHALRHSAITEVLSANGGNLVKAMRFSRHKDPRTVMVYEDNLNDAPGEMAAELERLVLQAKETDA